MTSLEEKLGISEEDLNTLYSSPDFNDILNQLNEKDENFARLPVEQKKLALALFLQGNTDAISKLWKFFYKRPVPTIEKFLTPEFIGSDAAFYKDWSPWTSDLKKILGPNSEIYQWVCCGAIGTAKTAVTRIAQFYNLYRVTSLRYPQLALGTGETKPMCIILITVSKNKAEEVLDGFKILLKNCKHFIKVKNEQELDQYVEFGDPHIVPYYCHKVEQIPRITFPNDVYITTGSQLNHTIGSDIFGAVLDEADFRKAKKGTADSGEELHNELVSRMTSRFINTNLKLLAVVSSAKHATGVMAKIIEETDFHSGRHHLSSYAIWEIKEDYQGAEETYGYFYALRGTKAHPSRMIDIDDPEFSKLDQGIQLYPDTCKVIKVPRHPILLDSFKTNVDKALRDQAGEFSSGGERPFDDLSYLVDTNLAGEIHFEAPLQKGISLFNQIPKTLWQKTPTGLCLRRYPGALRYIHLDLADSGEAGVSLCHKEMSKKGEIMYVFDFLGKITSPNRISFTMIEDFLVDLKNIGNINFQIISADQYQSVFMLQKLKDHKVAKEVKKLPMGTTTEPFNTCGTLVAEGAVKCGICKELKEQLVGIYFADGKVNYETDRKDIADTFTGSLYNAITNPSDIPTNYYESYEEILNNLQIPNIDGLKTL